MATGGRRLVDMTLKLRVSSYEGGRELWTSNTDWEKVDEEKTISPPRHIDAVESSMQRR